MNEGGRTDAKTENAKGVWARMKTTEVEDRKSKLEPQAEPQVRSGRERGLLGGTHRYLSLCFICYEETRTYKYSSKGSPRSCTPFLFRSKGPFPTLRLSIRSELLLVSPDPAVPVLSGHSGVRPLPEDPRSAFV